MDVILVVCIKLICIKPYLVVNSVATFNSFSIDVFCFVVVRLISIRIFICVRNLVCQLCIIIKKFRTSDIELTFIFLDEFTCFVKFRSRKNIFLWLELRFFWWSHTVVKFFIRNVANSCHKNFSCSIVFNCNCYIRFHCVVCNGCVCSFNFFYCVVVYAFLAFLEFKSFELNVTSRIVAYSFKSLTF